MRAKRIFEFERKDDLQSELGIGLKGVYNVDNVKSWDITEDGYRAVIITFNNNKKITFHSDDIDDDGYFDNPALDRLPTETYISENGKITAIFSIYSQSNDPAGPMWTLDDVEEINISRK